MAELDNEGFFKAIKIDKSIKTDYEIQLEKKVDTLSDLLWKVGICPSCRQVINHYLDEPFADCDCGTSESCTVPLLSQLDSKQILPLWEKLNK